MPMKPVSRHRRCKASKTAAVRLGGFEADPRARRDAGTGGASCRRRHPPPSLSRRRTRRPCRSALRSRGSAGSVGDRRGGCPSARAGGGWRARTRSHAATRSSRRSTRSALPGDRETSVVRGLTNTGMGSSASKLVHLGGVERAPGRRRAQAGSPGGVGETALVDELHERVSRGREQAEQRRQRFPVGGHQEGDVVARGAEDAAGPTLTELVQPLEETLALAAGRAANHRLRVARPPRGSGHLLVADDHGNAARAEIAHRRPVSSSTSPR